MRREDVHDLEAERLRRLRDRDREQDDFGQADYSNMYGYDARTRSGYPAYDDGRERPYDDGRERASRHWDEEPRREAEPRRHARRDGPSDRVMWAIIMERLHDERRLDLRDVEVEVHDGEVTLNGVVKHKSDKRRIEDIADIDGVRNVQNNLRARDRGRGWTFL